MNIILFCNSGSGKSTLAKLLSEYGYCHINTGEITRMMAKMDVHNLPVVVQTMIATMDFSKSHVFDHFYIHTYEQLRDLGANPIVVAVMDRRTEKPPINKKRHRFHEQLPKILTYFDKVHIKPIEVINTDYGFDVSELINAGILPFECMAMLKPEG